MESAVVLPNPQLIPPPPPPMQGPPPDPAMMGAPPPPPGPMGGMPPDPTMMGMPPMGMPGFPPGVMPDMNYPGSPAQQQAALAIAMQDEAVMLAMILQMLREADPDPGPKQPAWYRKQDYPRPSVGDIQSKAHHDRTDYQFLIDRIRKDRDRIQMAVVGVFDDFDPEVEETWRDPQLALDIQLIVSILGSADYLISKHARKAGEADDAQKIENWCYALFEQTEARHHRLYAIDYKMDVVKIALMAGHLVSRVLPNMYAEEGEIPVTIDLLDPTSCFPTFDDNGIHTMTRIYRQPLDQVFRGFQVKKNKRDGLLAKKDRDGKVRLITDLVEVTEYWDRRWYALLVDGDLVHGPVDHQMGVVPFVYTRSSVGDAGPMFEDNLSYGWGRTANAVQRDLASKGQSYIQYIQRVHEQREAVMGLVATELQKVKNPPRTFSQVLTRYGTSPLISNAPGGITLLKAGEEEEVPTQVDSRIQMLGPVMQSITEAAQRGMLSAVDHGQMPGSQTSGAVVEGLSEASKDKFNAWKIMSEIHHEAVLGLALLVERNYGRILGEDGNRGGIIAIEKQHPKPGEDGYFDFDYRLLYNNSCKVNVQMTSLRLQNLGALGNAVQMWRQQGLMTRIEALELRGVRDPHALARQIDIEAFEQTPEYQTASLIEWMKEEGMTDKLPTVLYLLATQGGGGGGGQQQGMMGPLPGNGGGPPTVGMPGAPGQEGGRPPQLPGPPPDMSGAPPGGM